MSAGALDPSFNSVGITSSGLFGGNGTLNGGLIQKDGKIVAYGVEGVTGPPQYYNEFGVARFNLDGSLDRSFGVRGQSVFSFGVKDSSLGATAGALQADGKIIVAGAGPLSDFSGEEVYVARLLSNGAIDSGFGVKGLARIAINGFQIDMAASTSVAIAPDGRILIGGNFDTSSGFAIRLTAAGAVDSSFASKGQIFLNQTESVDTLQVQSDGNILAQNVLLDSSGHVKKMLSIPGQGAYVRESNGTFIFPGSGEVDAYNADGSVDQHFGNHGVAQTPSPVSDFTLNDRVMIAPNGDLLAVNEQIDFSAGASRLAVARLTPSGTLDTSFGFSGISQTPSFYGLAGVNGAVMQPDGRLVVFGDDGSDVNHLDNAALQLPILARFTTTGRLDDSFGFAGTVETPNGISGVVDAIAVQSNGKIIVAGSEASPDPSREPTDAAIACYNPDGTLDTGFGVNGRAIIHIGNNANFSALAIEANGDIVVGGYGQVASQTEFALARYLPDGKPDLSFGNQGLALTGFGSPYAQECNSVAVQSNGDIVAAGETTNSFGDPMKMAVARYLPTGKLDTTFGVGGEALLTPGGKASGANCVVVDPSGRIVLGGSIGGNLGLARLTRAGTLDTSFGTQGSATRAILDYQGHASASTIKAMALDHTGNIVVDAIATDGFGITHLVRFLPTGRLDTSFDAIVPSNMLGVTAMALQSDGRIVIGGFDGDPILTRFTVAGKPDPLLSSDQLTHYHIAVRGTPQGPPITALAIQPDGKILAAGGSYLFRVSSS